MEEIKQQVKACGENSECLEKMNTIIQEDIELLPKRIADSADETVLLISRLDLKKGSCQTSGYARFEVNATKMFNDIVACIKSKK